MSWRGFPSAASTLRIAYEDLTRRAKPVMEGSFTPQVGGTHYQKSIQPWDAMEAWLTPAAFNGFLAGNVIKYIARYKDKNGVEDLKKARHYLDKLIEAEAAMGK